MAAKTARSTLRNARALIRATRTLGSSVPEGQLSWSHYVMQQYRDGRSAAPERARQLRRQANDTLGYIHELGVQKALNAEFGGEKLTQRERIKRTAGMVGLNMDAEAQRQEAADAEAEARAADGRTDR